jgi:predicted PurR-regulated permease PerM
VPIALLMSSLGGSVRTLIEALQQNTLQIPTPPETVAAWPVIGGKLHAVWSQAHDELPALLQSMQPKIGDLARTALGFVASIAGGLIALLGALVLAGIFMAFGEYGAPACLSVFERVAGEARGASLAHLSTVTIRAVGQGVVGVARIQAILVGLALLVAGVPWAGALAAMVLMLGIALVPAVIVTLPAIAWIWSRGGGAGEAIIYTVLLLVSGMADNMLKPLMLGRGVDVPMPVILVGALAGGWDHRDVRRRNPASPGLAGCHRLGRRESRRDQADFPPLNNKQGGRQMRPPRRYVRHDPAAGIENKDTSLPNLHIPSDKSPLLDLTVPTSSRRRQFMSQEPK